MPAKRAAASCKGDGSCYQKLLCRVVIIVGVPYQCDSGANKPLMPKLFEGRTYPKFKLPAAPSREKGFVNDGDRG